MLGHLGEDLAEDEVAVGGQPCGKLGVGRVAHQRGVLGRVDEGRGVGHARPRTVTAQGSAGRLPRPMPASEVFAPGLLDGQAALVTGGGTGLGKAAAAELVACGARVLIAGRRAEVVDAAASDLGCEWATGDVRSPDDAARLVDTALERFGRLDIL